MTAKSKFTDEEIEKIDADIKEKEVSVKFLVTDYTVEFLAQKVKGDEYYVPGYQRELIWKNPQQSKFIESVLVGLPIPFVFLWQDDEGKLEIVDGSQRLRTIVRFLDGDLTLEGCDLVPSLKGVKFSDLSESRRRKFNSRTMRGIVLDNSVSAFTRTTMFERINTGGTIANSAEVRRGALPGPVTNLITKLAKTKEFIEMTPISDQLVRSREREELIIRFFTYLERIEVQDGEFKLPDWHDRPSEYIYSFLEEANKKAESDAGLVARLNDEFSRMLDFVSRAFPFGFRKSDSGKQIPRVRFEAISVGSALAIRERPDIYDNPPDVSTWIEEDEFLKAVTSDGANVRSKTIGRIALVYGSLLE